MIEHIPNKYTDKMFAYFLMVMVVIGIVIMAVFITQHHGISQNQYAILKNQEILNNLTSNLENNTEQALNNQHLLNDSITDIHKLTESLNDHEEEEMKWLYTHNNSTITTGEKVDKLWEKIDKIFRGIKAQ